MTIEVTRGDSGLLVSGNGSSPRPLVWIEDRTWYSGEMYLAFGPGDASEPVQQLGFNPAKGLMLVFERAR
jgi:hypothetical protein